MIWRRARLPVTFFVMIVMAASVVALWPQSAAAVDFFPDSTCSGEAANSPACAPGDPITGTGGIIYRVTTLLAIVGGIAAVIGMIIGSFMFVTSGGDTSRVSSARKVIIYSLVGVVVIALARTIIVFVISRL